MKALMMDGAQLVDRVVEPSSVSRIEDARTQPVVIAQLLVAILYLLGTQEHIDALSPAVRGPCQHH